MHKTGEKKPQSGIYGSRCCGYEIALSKGETFPPCRRCSAATNWTLKRPTHH